MCVAEVVGAGQPSFWFVYKYLYEFDCLHRLVAGPLGLLLLRSAVGVVSCSQPRRDHTYLLWAVSGNQDMHESPLFIYLTWYTTRKFGPVFGVTLFCTR